MFFLFPNKNTLLPVFHVTEKPTAIVRGTSGSALTVNISFGDEPVKKWINELEKPYPLLLVDIKWAERFPETIRLIEQKKVPTGLLGSEGLLYESDEHLLEEQLQAYEEIFNEKPLWFRTSDEFFPESLHAALWNAKINALGSTFTWSGGKIPPIKEGEIISVSHHEENKINFKDLEALMKNRNIKTLEDALFGSIGKTKKIPD